MHAHNCCGIPIYKADEISDAKRFEQLSDKIEQKLGRAFRESVEQVRDQLDTELLQRLLSQGNTEAIVALVSTQLVASGLHIFAEELRRAYEAGAGLAVETAKPVRMPSGSLVQVQFNTTNPRTTEFLNTYRMDKIREVTEDMREVVRETVRRNILAGVNPIQAAREVKRVIGLTSWQEQRVQNYRRLLESLDGEALNRALRDGRFDRTIATAITENRALKPEQVERMVERYREKFIRMRSETIARTESTRSLNAGNKALWEQQIEQGLVSPYNIRRMWIFTRDERTRESHRMIPQMNPQGVAWNEPFRSPLGLIMYPGDPAARAANTINCRCTLFYRVRYPTKEGE